MGGGHRYEYPKYVWSPAGGWWCEPRNWKRNTFFLGLGVALLSIPIYIYGERHSTVYKRKPVYSERLCELAKENRESHHH